MVLSFDRSVLLCIEFMLGKSMLFFCFFWASCCVGNLPLGPFFFFGTSLTGSEGLRGCRLGETAVWPQAGNDWTTLPIAKFSNGALDGLRNIALCEHLLWHGTDQALQGVQLWVCRTRGICGWRLRCRVRQGWHSEKV